MLAVVFGVLSGVCFGALAVTVRIALRSGVQPELGAAMTSAIAFLITAALALGAWSGVRISPMFGRWGYFVGEHLFACFPLRVKEHDLWIRLSPFDQARALRLDGMRPHRRFAARGWVECDVESPADVSRALGWLRRSYEAVRRPGAP